MINTLYSGMSSDILYHITLLHSSAPSVHFPSTLSCIFQQELHNNSQGRHQCWGHREEDQRQQLHVARQRRDLEREEEVLHPGHDT